MHLSDRAALILGCLVHQYIKSGQPVGSKALADHREISFSSATIRNILAELEGQGLLSSLHTSSGRVPTDLGLRYFVDHLANLTPGHISLDKIAQQLKGSDSTQTLLASASGVLSSLSQWVGVVTVPRAPSNILRHVEFLPLQDNRMLVVLVVNESEVHNRIIEMREDYTLSELRQVGQFLTEQFSGKELFAIRTELIGAMKAHQIQADRIMKTAIRLADEAFVPQNNDEMLLTGESNLLALPQKGILPVEELQTVFHAFKEKQEILKMLDACLTGEGVQIFIGEESGFKPLKHCSIVTSRYDLGDKGIGVLGVIGPTRMAYDKVIPMVEGTAKLLSNALNLKQRPPYTD